MLIAPTLTVEDFKSLHNARCELHHITSQIRPVAAPAIIASLEKAMQLMSDGLAGAYAEEDRIFTERTKAAGAIAKQLGIKHSSWSMLEIADMTAVPYPEATLLRYDGGFGSQVEVPLAPGSDWTSLWRAADTAIKQSGDSHHTFIESLTLVDGVVVLSCGS